MHDAVAELSAKLHRVGKLIGFIAAHGADQREGHNETQHECHRAALRRLVQVQLGEVRGYADLLQSPPAFVHHAGRNQDESGDQERGRHHVSQNADVWRGLAAEQVDRHQEHDVGSGDNRQRQSDQADWVLNEILGNGRMIAQRSAPLRVLSHERFPSFASP